MMKLGSEATIIRLHTLIFLCRPNPLVKYLQNSTFLFIFFLNNFILKWNKSVFFLNLFFSYFILSFLFLSTLYTCNCFFLFNIEGNYYWTEIRSWINNYKDYSRRRSNIIMRMIRNFEYLIVDTTTPGVLPEQNDRYHLVIKFNLERKWMK